MRISCHSVQQGNLVDLSTAGFAHLELPPLSSLQPLQLPHLAHQEQHRFSVKKPSKTWTLLSHQNYNIGALLNVAFLNCHLQKPQIFLHSIRTAHQVEFQVHQSPGIGPATECRLSQHILKRYHQ